VPPFPLLVYVYADVLVVPSRKAGVSTRSVATQARAVALTARWLPVTRGVLTLRRRSRGEHE
jgi:hypothetical protein